MIRLGHVEVNERTAERVKSMLLHGIVGQSEIIEEFEESFARWLGVKHCIAVSSGTMADTIALAVLKHFNPTKTEVILPALTFAAHLNSVLYNGLEPVFIDAGEGLNIGGEIESAISQKTLCIFPVHLLGRPADMRGILTLARAYKVNVIEDSCEAMGSLYDMTAAFIKCGAMGDMGTFSFFPSHVITTGEGGMISTNNDEFAALAKRLRNHGKVSDADFHFDVVGFNGKMSSVLAAIGIEALKEIDVVVQKRRNTYFALGGKEDHWERICPHAFPVVLGSESERDRKLSSLKNAGVECRNLFSSLPTQEKAYGFLGYRPGDFPYAEMIGRCGLYVPCHGAVEPEQVEKIKAVLREA